MGKSPATAAKRPQKSDLSINQRHTRRESEIITRLENYFGKRIKDLNDPISLYIEGEAEAPRSLADALNRYDGFHDDGLGLTPGDMQGATTIGMVEYAIVIWYMRNNWNVIHRAIGG